MNRRQFLASAAVTSLAAPALIRSAGAQQESPFRVKYYPVQAGMGSRDVTAAPDGTIWFNGQRNGTLGRLDPKSGDMTVFKSPRGRGTYGMTITPKGDIWYASLALSLIHISEPTRPY